MNAKYGFFNELLGDRDPMADRSDDGESVSDPGQPVDGLSYMFLIVTGALQSIPADLVEAAKIDGANTFQVAQCHPPTADDRAGLHY